MRITGKWKVTEANVFDKSFKRSWRGVGDVLADESIPPMQKAMTRMVYVFGEDGTALTLLPKGIAPAGEAESYDDKFDLMHKSEWKEEGGKLCLATIDNGNTEWNEITGLTPGTDYRFYVVPKLTASDMYAAVALARVTPTACIDVTTKTVQVSEAKISGLKSIDENQLPELCTDYLEGHALTTTAARDSFGSAIFVSPAADKKTAPSFRKALFF